MPRPDEIEYASPAQVKAFPVGANLFRKWLVENVDGYWFKLSSGRR